MSNKVVIVDVIRTGLAKSFRGELNLTRPDDMCSHVMDALLDRNPQLSADQVEDVVVGCGFPESYQGNIIGRSCIPLSRLPITTSGMVVNRYCSSGLQSIAIAATQIASGYSDCIMAGGVDSISLVEKNINLKGFVNPKIQKSYPGIYHSMIQTAETVAERYGISREDQDAYAYRSQHRTAKAQADGLFVDEIVPLKTVMQQTDKETGVVSHVDVVCDRDTCNRPDTSMEGLTSLKPVIKASGSVTAGNACQKADGAAMALVMSESKAKQLGLKPKLVFKGFVTVGCEPDEMGIGPVYAIPKLLKHAGLKVTDIDLWELNEAFACQVLYIQNQLGIPEDCLNVNGGSIAIGHPYGMTGTRQVGHVARELIRRNGRYAVVTMCVGGGQGAAALFERYQ